MSLTYINPVELLNLAGMPVTTIDAAIIKKKRKGLLADLELGDGTKEYNGQRLDRSACERACLDLDEPEHLRVWHRLANMPALNDFLGNGRVDFLISPSSVSSLKADADLLRLVGPRYAAQYDQALIAAFRARDAASLQFIVLAPELYLPAESRKAHQSLNRLLREKLEEVRQQEDSFDEDDDAEKVMIKLRRTLFESGWPTLINALPNEFFGAVRTEQALAVRDFAIQFHNTFFKQAPTLKLLQDVAALQMDTQAADRVREDIRQVREIEVKEQNRARMDAVAGRFGKAFEQLLTYQRQIDAGSLVSMATVRQWGTDLATLIAELNPMTDSEIATARDTMALGLRGLAVAIWNKNQANGDTAISLLTTGLTLRVGSATTAKLTADKSQLARMISERKQDELNRQKRVAAEQNKKQDTSSGCLVFFIIIAVIAVIIAIANAGKSTSSSYASTTTETATVDTSTPAATGVGGIPPPTYEPEVSKYAGNQLRNGSSPLDNCFGRSRYAGPAWVNFKNDNNDTDAIVCLARTRDNKVIRNEYIRAGTSFRMSRIPAGSYYLKVFYGRDWNPKRRSACGTKGYFDTNQRFSESRAAGDLINIEVSSRSYTTGTMTLYSVAGGNMAQQSIDANEFFRQ